MLRLEDGAVVVEAREIFEHRLKHPTPALAEVTDVLAALGKSLGAFFTDPNRSLGRLAPISHDERVNRFQ